jgi:hypothetical protein
MIPSSLQNAYQKHSRWLPIAFFLLGFAFDMLTLSRIDALSTLLQQAAYIGIAAFLVVLELIEGTRELAAPRLLARVWEYREAALHFVLGALLSGYTIFYFKSASALTSFVFIALLLGLLVANEFLRFGKARTQVHSALLALCLISFMASLSPILLGFIGTLPFLCALTASGLISYGLVRVTRPRIPSHPELLRKQMIRPIAATHLAFAALYFAHLIPPVPLSVRYMGIYHGVEKKDGAWYLSYTRPAWKLCHHGDQTFLARPGDVVHGYVQVFSPARFKDELKIRWLLWDEKRGWQSQDAIPFPVTGGREEGYRGVTKKSFYSPGLWRVQVETQDEQEIGRIGFRIQADTETEARELKTEIR